MLDRVVHRTDLSALIDELARTRRIVGPVKHEDRFFYEAVDRAGRLDLDFTYCVYSPKAQLLPPKETLLTFDRTTGNFTCHPLYDERPTVLAGVHPCDLHAIKLLDHVFGAEHADEQYLSRRRHMFLIGIDCPHPCTAGVFCRDMHAHVADSGFDLMCYPLERDQAGRTVRYGVQVGTTAGQEAILYGRVGTPPTPEAEQHLARYQAEKDRAFPKAIPVDSAGLPGLLAKSYDSLLWEATARRCYSCGSCNLVCPTCYCFDIHDDGALGGNGGERVREWDGCQLRGFAEVAGPHNFRPKPGSRLRHRVFRKGKWILERTGLPGCVGCARCDRACTARISLVDMYKQLAEEV
ncbi:MAG: 4Fe-4S dicluster domain-containing protein [Planctomycetes bacterium]|nr:4Fe-4S dicluster domain-containing protein [Planctomycetota bacterium]